VGKTAPDAGDGRVMTVPEGTNVWPASAARAGRPRQAGIRSDEAVSDPRRAPPGDRRAAAAGAKGSAFSDAPRREI
jgi:hypothetical protein